MAVVKIGSNAVPGLISHIDDFVDSVSILDSSEDPITFGSSETSQPCSLSNVGESLELTSNIEFENISGNPTIEYVKFFDSTDPNTKYVTVELSSPVTITSTTGTFILDSLNISVADPT